MSKRVYTFLALRHGGHFDFWPHKVFETRMRIRQTCVVLFKKWYGDYPQTIWYKDGFMAEAWDRKGRKISIEQINEK